MLVINCTKSAADFFTQTQGKAKQSPLETPENKKITEDNEVCTNPGGGVSTLYQWQVHAIQANRRHCLVVMEIKTRYSITLTNVKKGDAEGFVRNFIDRLLTNMLRYGKELELLTEDDFEPMLNEFTEQHAGCRFYQRADRSVQTHINDVVWHFRNQVDELGIPKSAQEEALFDHFVNSLLRTTKLRADYFTPSEEMIVNWLSELLAFDEERLEATRKALLKQSAARFDHLFESTKQQTSDQYQHKRKEAETASLPDNVVSMAEYRRQKN